MKGKTGKKKEIKESKGKENKERSKTKLKIRRIDEHYRFALDFFWEYGKEFFKSIEYDPRDGGVKIFRVGFVGFGEYAYEFLKVLCSLGQLPRCRLIVYIFDKSAKARKEMIQKELLEHCVNQNEVVATRLNSENKGERNLNESSINILKSPKYHDEPFYEIHFVECDVEKSQFSDNCFIRIKRKKIGVQAENDNDDANDIIEHFTHMFFMLGSDKTNLNVATKVSIAYQRNPEKDEGQDTNTNSSQAIRQKTEPQFYVMVKNDDTTAQLREEGNLFKETYPNIRLIGTTSERYSIDAIEESELEELGEKVHKLYSFNKSLQNIRKIAEKKSGGDNKYEKIVYKAVEDYLVADYNKHSAESVLDSSFKNLFDAICRVEAVDAAKKALAIGQKEQEIIELIEPTVREALKPIEWLYDSERLEEDYNKREYYRRSAKSRALFEKMLFELGYLYLKDNDGKKNVKPHNIVSEFGVNEDTWKLPDEDNPNSDENYKPKKIPTYKIGRLANSLYCKTYESKEEIKIKHVNVQWFEVNNILQKRWMVFRWAEGYIGRDINEIEEKELKDKSHKYLRPYIEIYVDEDMRSVHTIDVIIAGMADKQVDGKYIYLSHEEV